MRHPDKNSHYFHKSNIPVINLDVGCSSFIKVSKDMSLQKNLLAFFIAFGWGRFFENAVDK